MSLHPQPLAPVPAQTVRVASAAFPKGNPYLILREHLGPIFQDEDFAALFPAWGYPGLPPWRLALVTIMGLQALSPSCRARHDRVCSWRAKMRRTAPLLKCNDRILACLQKRLVQ